MLLKNQLRRGRKDVLFKNLRDMAQLFAEGATQPPYMVSVSASHPRFYF